MSNFESGYNFSSDNPESLLPISEKEVDDLSVDIDHLINSGDCYESIQAELKGNFLELNYSIRAEHVYDEDNDYPDKEYYARFSLASDDYEAGIRDPSQNVLHVGYDPKRGYHCALGGEKHTDDKIAKDINYYASHLMRLIALTEQDPIMKENVFYLETAGASYALIDDLLYAGENNDWKAMHKYTKHAFGGEIEPRNPDQIADDIMQSLNKNNDTTVTNSKNISLELEDNSEINFFSSTEIKNSNSEHGIEIYNSRSIEHINYHQAGESNKKATEYSKEIELVYENGMPDMQQTVVYEHKEENSFFEEQKEYVRFTTNMVGKLDNKIVKSPVLGDYAYFKDKIRQANTILNGE